jgi:hypothetical protein
MVEEMRRKSDEERRKHPQTTITAKGGCDMTSIKRMSLVLGVMTLIIFCGSLQTNAQIAKSGDFSGKFVWHFPGPVVELEKDHMVWGGAASGAFYNDAGDGFLHGAIVICTAAGEAEKGAQIHNDGNCVSSDKDGDKMFAVWSCSECPNKTTGTFKWTGGTGKFAGLKGGGTYQETGLGPGQLGFYGWSVWKGNYQLP